MTDSTLLDTNTCTLPRTFRDAILVTRGIGVEYLWIDSLCSSIIQDDPADWAYEAARMEQVFSEAYVTIGASSATSSLEGFLLPRESRGCVSVSVDVNVPGREGKEGDDRKEKREVYVFTAIDDFSNDVEGSHLSRRGWVLQERALSRRSVFYTENQVYWECGAGVHCETLTRLQKYVSLSLSFFLSPLSTYSLLLVWDKWFTVCKADLI